MLINCWDLICENLCTRVMSSSWRLCSNDSMTRDYIDNGVLWWVLLPVTTIMNVLLGIMWCRNSIILDVADREQLGNVLLEVKELVHTPLILWLACLVHFVAPRTEVSRGPWECGRVANRPPLSNFLTKFFGPDTARLLLLMRNCIDFTSVQLSR